MQTAVCIADQVFFFFIRIRHPCDQWIYYFQNGIIQSVNREFMKLFGYARNEVVGKKVLCVYDGRTSK